MRRAIVAAAVVLATVSGCSGDWFGNDKPPVPTTASLPTCKAGLVPAPDENLGGPKRPTEVPPGWWWIVIAPEVRALKANDKVADYCVPFSLHVYANMQGAPAVVMVDLGAPRTLPYDGFKVTPWTGAYFVLAFDPTSERFKVAPQYTIQVIAKYEPERDTFGEGPLSAFRCALKANGVTVAQQIALAAANMTARCDLTSNYYNTV